MEQGRSGRVLQQGLGLVVLCPDRHGGDGTGRLILGTPTLRLRGDYLAIVTLGFGEIIRLLADNLTDVTNGPRGSTRSRIRGWGGERASAQWCVLQR